MKAAQGKLLKYVLSVLILLILTGEIFSQNFNQLNSREFRFTKNYQLGLTAFNKEDFQAAEFYLNACLDQQPRNREALLLRAMCRQRTGQINGAIRDYSMLISIDPHHAEALYGRGILFYKNQQYGPASEDFERLLDIPASETQAVFYKNKANEKGISAVATIKTMEADIYNYLGLCAQQMKRYQEALDYYTAAIKRFPNQTDFHINRGLTFEATGQMSRAVEDFKNALKPEPDNEIAKHNLARLQLERPDDQTSEVIAAYTEMIDSNPEFEDAYFNRGLAYFKSGRFKKALSDYNQAILLDSSSAKTWYNRALVKEQLEDFDGALSDLDHSIDIQPNFEKAWHGKGIILTKMKQYENAISMFDLAIYYAPDFALAYYNRGIARLNLKQNEEACKDLKEALKLGMITAKKMIDKKCN